MNQDSTTAASRHWDEWQALQKSDGTSFVDWGDHPLVLALVFQDLFGSSTTTFFDYLKSAYPSFANARALSLCCGDGAFERSLVNQGVFGHVVGVDLSPVRVQLANDNRGGQQDRLEYRVADANLGEFGREAFDIVFAKAALHHIEALETLFGGVNQCLVRGGRLVTIDFFGPTRFQWTDRQLAAVNHFLATEVPEDLLRKPDGTLHRNVQRPSVEQMIAMDPSEAVRSGELYAQLKASMRIEKEFAIGGTLLNLILDGGIVNNFDPGNRSHNQIIERAFKLERTLMAEGEIGSDFMFIVAGSG